MSNCGASNGPKQKGTPKKPKLYGGGMAKKKKGYHEGGTPLTMPKGDRPVYVKPSLPKPKGDRPRVDDFYTPSKPRGDKPTTPGYTRPGFLPGFDPVTLPYRGPRPRPKPRPIPGRGKPTKRPINRTYGILNAIRGGQRGPK